MPPPAPDQGIAFRTSYETESHERFLPTEGSALAVAEAKVLIAKQIGLEKEFARRFDLKLILVKKPGGVEVDPGRELADDAELVLPGSSLIVQRTLWRPVEPVTSKAQTHVAEWVEGQETIAEAKAKSAAASAAAAAAIVTTGVAAPAIGPPAAQAEKELLPAQFVCGHCGGLLRNAMAVRCSNGCNESVCKQCAAALLTASQPAVCPECRQPTVRNFIINKALIGIISRLQLDRYELPRRKGDVNGGGGAPNGGPSGVGAAGTVGGGKGGGIGAAGGPESGRGPRVAVGGGSGVQPRGGGESTAGLRGAGIGERGGAEVAHAEPEPPSFLIFLRPEQVGIVHSQSYLLIPCDQLPVLTPPSSSPAGSAPGSGANTPQQSKEGASTAAQAGGSSSGAAASSSASSSSIPSPPANTLPGGAAGAAPVPELLADIRSSNLPVTICVFAFGGAGTSLQSPGIVRVREVAMIDPTAPSVAGPSHTHTHTYPPPPPASRKSSAAAALAAGINVADDAAARPLSREAIPAVDAVLSEWWPSPERLALAKTHRWLFCRVDWHLRYDTVILLPGKAQPMAGIRAGCRNITSLNDENLSYECVPMTATQWQSVLHRLTQEAAFHQRPSNGQPSTAKGRGPSASVGGPLPPATPMGGSAPPLAPIGGTPTGGEASQPPILPAQPRARGPAGRPAPEVLPGRPSAPKPPPAAPPRHPAGVTGTSIGPAAAATVASAQPMVQGDFVFDPVSNSWVARNRLPRAAAELFGLKATGSGGTGPAAELVLRSVLFFRAAVPPQSFFARCQPPASPTHWSQFNPLLPFAALYPKLEKHTFLVVQKLQLLALRQLVEDGQVPQDLLQGLGQLDANATSLHVLAPQYPPVSQAVPGAPPPSAVPGLSPATPGYQQQQQQPQQQQPRTRRGRRGADGGGGGQAAPHREMPHRSPSRGGRQAQPGGGLLSPDRYGDLRPGSAPGGRAMRPPPSGGQPLWPSIMRPNIPEPRMPQAGSYDHRLSGGQMYPPTGAGGQMMEVERGWRGGKRGAGRLLPPDATLQYHLHPGIEGGAPHPYPQPGLFGGRGEFWPSPGGAAARTPPPGRRGGLPPQPLWEQPRLSLEPGYPPVGLASRLYGPGGGMMPMPPGLQHRVLSGEGVLPPGAGYYYPPDEMGPSRRGSGYDMERLLGPDDMAADFYSGVPGDGVGTRTMNPAGDMLLPPRKRAYRGESDQSYEPSGDFYDGSETAGSGYSRRDYSSAGADRYDVGDHLVSAGRYTDPRRYSKRHQRAPPPSTESLPPGDFYSGEASHNAPRDSTTYQYRPPSTSNSQHGRLGGAPPSRSLDLDPTADASRRLARQQRFAGPVPAVVPPSRPVIGGTSMFEEFRRAASSSTAAAALNGSHVDPSDARIPSSQSPSRSRGSPSGGTSRPPASGLPPPASTLSPSRHHRQATSAPADRVSSRTAKESGHGGAPPSSSSSSIRHAQSSSTARQPSASGGDGGLPPFRQPPTSTTQPSSSRPVTAASTSSRCVPSSPHSSASPLCGAGPMDPSVLSQRRHANAEVADRLDASLSDYARRSRRGSDHSSGGRVGGGHRRNRGGRRGSRDEAPSVGLPTRSRLDGPAGTSGGGDRPLSGSGTAPRAERDSHQKVTSWLRGNELDAKRRRKIDGSSAPVGTATSREATGVPRGTVASPSRANGGSSSGPMPPTASRNAPSRDNGSTTSRAQTSGPAGAQGPSRGTRAVHLSTTPTSSGSGVGGGTTGAAASSSTTGAARGGSNRQLLVVKSAEGQGTGASRSGRDGIHGYHTSGGRESSTSGSGRPSAPLATDPRRAAARLFSASLPQETPCRSVNSSKGGGGAVSFDHDDDTRGGSNRNRAVGDRPHRGGKTGGGGALSPDSQVTPSSSSATGGVGATRKRTRNSLYS